MKKKLIVTGWTKLSFGSGMDGRNEYIVEDTDITLTYAAGCWYVKRNGERVKRHDSFVFAKAHALALAT